MGRAWKSAEKEVAEFFGVQRRIRVRYDESIGDTTAHDVYSIEVKYGKQVPKYLCLKWPTIVSANGRHFAVIRSDLWFGGDQLADTLLFEVKNIKGDVKFLTDALDQARSYNPAKVPLACFKPRSCRGFIMAVEVDEDGKVLVPKLA